MAPSSEIIREIDEAYNDWMLDHDRNKIDKAFKKDDDYVGIMEQKEF